MIYQIILPLLHILRRTEINPILLTNILYLLVCPRQPNYTWVKLGEVFLQDTRSVSGRIAGYEDWEDGLDLGGVGGAGRDGRRDGGGWRGVRGWCGGRESCVYEVYHLGHFVEFFGADVGAVGEAKVDLLRTISVSTRLFRYHHLMASLSLAISSMSSPACVLPLILAKEFHSPTNTVPSYPHPQTFYRIDQLIRKVLQPWVVQYPSQPPQSSSFPSAAFHIGSRKSTPRRNPRTAIPPSTRKDLIDILTSVPAPSYRSAICWC